MKLRIATRRSALALTQTRYIAAELKKHRPELEIEEVTIETKGDKETSRPLAAIGGKGLFVSEVEALVVSGAADIAVHSLKDVPGDVDLPEGFDLICFPEREDARDLLITADGRTFEELPEGAIVGTTSLRREAQLRERRPDLQIKMLRGNVQTRLSRLDAGEFDAIILAAAGIKRLELDRERKFVPLPIELSLPAVGQGTLGIEASTSRAELLELLAPLECRETRIVTEAERRFLRLIEGSCRAAIAAHAQLDASKGRLRIDGYVGDLEGSRSLRASAEAELGEEPIAAARALGEELARKLIDAGAPALMREAEAAVLKREAAAESRDDRFRPR